MSLLIEQLQRRVAELGRWIELEQTPPARVRIIRETTPNVRAVEFDDSTAPLLDPTDGWREPLDTTVWLRFACTRPDTWPIEDTALVARRFGTYPVEIEQRIGLNLQRMQGMLYVDGRPYHGLDQYHRLIYMPPGPEYHCAASIWTGLAELEWQPTPVFQLVRIDPAAVGVVHDLRILADALRSLPSEDPARPALEHLAEAALLVIDWSLPGGESFRTSLGDAHRRVNDGLRELHAATYEPTLIAAGHAHIDCAWLWPISQTREKAGRTWSTALRLMERYPSYHFLASSPLQYEMVKHDFPETFDGIRQRIREGRWEAVGGMWVEADCNLPDGESLARQILVGTRYFEREFGVDTTVVWLPDCFGFTWALPTLLAAAGLRRFVTHKLSWSQTNRIPHDTFRWRGPDGSEVLAHFLCTPSLWPGEHTTYNGTLLPGVARGAWQRFVDRNLHDELLVAFGYGDGGGGPTIDMLEGGQRLADLPGFPRVRLGRADEFFGRLEKRLAERTDVPIWDGELYLEYHRGTYTGQAAQKQRNALSQRLYHAAELYASTAHVLLGTDYPRAELDEGWRLILTNQFHDILPGSAISPVYEDAQRDFEQLRSIGTSVLDTAAHAIAAAVPLAGESLVVFNPSPYPSAAYLEVAADAVPAGVAAQRTGEDTCLVYLPDVPPMGYAAFPIGEPERPESGLHVSEREIDTPFWNFELDAQGRLTRLHDKQTRREILAPGQLGNRLVVFEDKPLNYDAWDIDPFFASKSRELELLQTEPAAETPHAEGVDRLLGARVLERGPLRGVVEFRWRVGDHTRVSQRLTVYAHLPRIDFVTEVDWQERQSLLKVAFPTRIRNRRATYEIQFGTIDRPTHRNTSWEEAAFEVPAQRWADLSDASSGVALLADCKHGFSVHEDTLWLSLLKGGIDPDPNADRGLHRFTYALLPHGPGLEEVRRAAYALTRPLFGFREPAHAGHLPERFSLAACADPNVVVETAKWAEDEDALVLRVYEAAGGARRAAVQVGGAPTTLSEVDLLERNPRVAAAPLEFRAREIKSLLAHYV